MTKLFPQLKRLERLVSKAEETRAVEVDEGICCYDSPFAASELKFPVSHHNMSCLDSAYSFEDVWQRSPSYKIGRSSRETSLHTSRCSMDSWCAPEEKFSSSKFNGTLSHEGCGSRMSVCHTLHESTSCKSRGRRQLSRQALSPLTCPTPLKDHGPTSPTTRHLLRQMQMAPPSDALDVLSEEESDDHDNIEEEKRLRCPLPTMPLSIMVPVAELPDCIVPLDCQRQLNNVHQFDDSIGSMMHTRNNLAQSYTLFDDLCRSFNGFDNLDRFLRSLVATSSTGCNDAMTKTKNQSNAESRSRRKAPPPKNVRAQRSSVQTRAKNAKAPSSKTSKSRLLCPTTASLLKQVEQTDKAFKSHKKTPKNQMPSNTQRPKNSKSGRTMETTQNKKQLCQTSVRGSSDEDVRKELMQRVRRGLVILSSDQKCTSSQFCVGARVKATAVY